MTPLVEKYKSLSPTLIYIYLATRKNSMYYTEHSGNITKIIFHLLGSIRKNGRFGVGTFYDGQNFLCSRQTCMAQYEIFDGLHSIGFMTFYFPFLVCHNKIFRSLVPLAYITILIFKLNCEQRWIA